MEGYATVIEAFVMAVKINNQRSSEEPPCNPDHNRQGVSSEGEMDRVYSELNRLFEEFWHGTERKYVPSDRKILKKT